ncbi:MAG: type II toxin-antitoxin system RelE/ParE family toxin [Ornithinibacter sp.]
MSYRVEVAPATPRQIRRLDPPTRRRIQAAIELLAHQPRPGGAKKLVGGEGEWRVRSGDDRSIYEIHEPPSSCWSSSPDTTATSTAADIAPFTVLAMSASASRVMSMRE